MRSFYHDLIDLLSLFLCILQHLVDRHTERSFIATSPATRDQTRDFNDMTADLGLGDKATEAEEAPARPDLALIPTTFEEWSYALTDLALRLFENVMGLARTSLAPQ